MQVERAECRAPRPGALTFTGLLHLGDFLDEVTNQESVATCKSIIMP